MYDEVLNPYLRTVLDSSIEADAALRRIFDLVERLATSPDERVRDVVVATICPPLFGERGLHIAERYMGRATRRLLKRARKGTRFSVNGVSGL